MQVKTLFLSEFLVAVSISGLLGCSPKAGPNVVPDSWSPPAPTIEVSGASGANVTDSTSRVFDLSDRLAFVEPGRTTSRIRKIQVIASCRTGDQKPQEETIEFEHRLRIPFQDIIPVTALFDPQKTDQAVSVCKFQTIISNEIGSTRTHVISEVHIRHSRPAKVMHLSVPGKILDPSKEIPELDEKTQMAALSIDDADFTAGQVWLLCESFHASITLTSAQPPDWRRLSRPLLYSPDHTPKPYNPNQLCRFTARNLDQTTLLGPYVRMHFVPQPMMVKFSESPVNNYGELGQNLISVFTLQVTNPGNLPVSAYLPGDTGRSFKIQVMEQDPTTHVEYITPPRAVPLHYTFSNASFVAKLPSGWLLTLPPGTTLDIDASFAAGFPIGKLGGTNGCNHVGIAFGFAPDMDFSIYQIARPGDSPAVSSKKFVARFTFSHYLPIQDPNRLPNIRIHTTRYNLPPPTKVVPRRMALDRLMVCQ